MAASCRNSGAASTTAITTEGYASFDDFPTDSFRYKIVCSNADAHIVLESKQTMNKWECHVDDKTFQAFGPEGISIPRIVILNLLADRLANPSKTTTNDHEIGLQAASSRELELIFTLDFGAGFTPAYKFRLLPVPVKVEERLQAQIVDLQKEVQEMKQQMADLQKQWEDHGANCCSKSTRTKALRPTAPNVGSQNPTYRIFCWQDSVPDDKAVVEEMDASLGSLPTLIVPDDPETGAIEKPKTPPPIQIDEARMVAPINTKKTSSKNLVDAAGPAASISTTNDSTTTPTQQQPETPKRTPREKTTAENTIEIAIGSTDDMKTSSPPQVASSDASTIASPSAIATETSSTTVTARPMTATTRPTTANARASAISSKDYAGMAKRASALAKLDRLGAGNKSIFEANMNDIGALGIGMQLYFMLTKYLSIVFVIMGIISLPAITVNYYGNGVTSKSVDPLKLAYASLGNQGVCDEIAQDPSLCLPQGDIDCNWTTVNTPFTSNPITVSWIITICDLLYSLVFLIFFLVYRHKALRAIDLHMNENLTPAKYAVYVRGLPKDANEKEILQHFNDLYDLTKEDEYFTLWFGCCWSRKRRKVKNSLSKNAVNRNVVTNLDHLADPSLTEEQQEKNEMYLNTWIAEVSIGRPTGGLLRLFLSMEALTRNIAETQNLIAILEEEKRESANATTEDRKKNKKHAFKPADGKLLQKAKAKLEKLNTQLEKKTSKIKAFKQQTELSSPKKKDGDSNKHGNDAKLKRQETKTKMSAAAAAAKKAATDTQQEFNLEACECAFVVFNNIESRRRCIRDYRKSTYWLAHKFQPKMLRFRDGKYPLVVVPAPEPSNILWENLEITDRGRFYRRSLTNFVTFLLLLFSCAIISGAQSAQQQFKSKMPPSGLCDYSLPIVFYGNSSFNDDPNISWDLEWDRNATCLPGENGETRYYVAYTNDIVNALNISKPVTVKAGETAPKRCVDPCVSDTSSITCNTLPCFDLALQDEGETCETYQASHVLYCFCMTALTTSIDTYGLFDGPRMLWNEYVPCQGFIKDYLTKNGFIIVASSIVVIVNLLLKAILRAFANFERHSSESAKASAIAIKMFSAQFLNTAIIVLIVNASLGLKNIPLAKDLFKGSYDDFERDWYPSVGIGITMTMLINAFVPQIVLFLQMFIVTPLKKCMTKRSIRTQEQMNKLYAGPPFDISVRYPMLLNSVLVTLCFCGGSPVLLFIAALTAAGTFWFDKLSIIHLFSIKTTYDEELGEVALSILPWMLFLHLGFSTWMYGNQNLMKSTTLDLPWVLDTFGIPYDADTMSVDAMYQQLLKEASKFDILGAHGLVVKIVHPNVMLVFLFCICLLVGIFLSTIWTQMLLPVLEKTIGIILKAIWLRIRAHVRVFPLNAKSSKKNTKKKKTKTANKSTAKVAVETSQPATPPSADANAVTTVPADSKSIDTANPPPGSEPLVLRSTFEISETSTTPAGGKTEATLSSILSPRKKREVLIPEFTEYFRKSVPLSFKPDKLLGFDKDENGALVRYWREETVINGLKRTAGEPMRTWEAMQAPVRTYAIEANSKYKLAVTELLAAAKRSRSISQANTQVLEIDHHNAENKEDDRTKSVGAIITESITATEPTIMTAELNKESNEFTEIQVETPSAATSISPV